MEILKKSDTELEITHPITRRVMKEVDEVEIIKNIITKDQLLAQKVQIEEMIRKFD